MKIKALRHSPPVGIAREPYSCLSSSMSPCFVSCPRRCVMYAPSINLEITKIFHCIIKLETLMFVIN
ncbi:hypothetical protein Plhal304r1_c013g0049711 [Plasmopara halstedii]